MEELYKVILDISKAAIHDSLAAVHTQIEWNRAKDILAYGKMSGIVAKQIGMLKTSLGVPESEYNLLKGKMVSRGISQMTKIEHLGSILKAAKEYKLHPVVFKGIILAELYPEPYMRFSSDTDIYIDESEAKEMENLLISMGFNVDLLRSKEHVPVFYDARDGMRIELHDRLWEDYEGTQVKLLETIGFTTPEHLIHKNVLGIDLVTLRPEEHLVYQIFHMAKHLALEGLPLRYLADLTLYTECYAKEIDWKHFWKSMELLKYDVFAATLFDLCLKYLGLAETIYIPSNISVRMSDELIEDVMCYGIKREDVDEAYATSGFVTQYLMRDHIRSRKQGKQVRMLLFPAPNELKKKYEYAKKYPILLPIAWIHRFWSAIKYALICHKKGLSAIKVVEKAGHRINLIADLNIVDVEK